MMIKSSSSMSNQIHLSRYSLASSAITNVLQNVSGYVCNHGSLRVGNETLRPLGVAMGNVVSVTRV